MGTYIQGPTMSRRIILSSLSCKLVKASVASCFQYTTENAKPAANNVHAQQKHQPMPVRFLCNMRWMFQITGAPEGLFAILHKLVLLYPCIESPLRGDSSPDSTGIVTKLNSTWVCNGLRDRDPWRCECALLRHGPWQTSPS